MRAHLLLLDQRHEVLGGDPRLHQQLQELLPSQQVEALPIHRMRLV
jgi:hypothetical protein